MSIFFENLFNGFSPVEDGFFFNWIIVLLVIYNILLKIKKLWAKFKFYHDNDPVKKCELYLAEGCSHVDGPLCDFPKCSMRNAYLVEESFCPHCGFYCTGKTVFCTKGKGNE